MKKRSCKLLVFAAALAVFSGCGEPDSSVAEAQAEDRGPLATITLGNPSEFARNDEIAVFSYDELGLAAGKSYRVTGEDGEVASHASDTDGDGEADSLVFVADHAPAESKTYQVVEGVAAVPGKRTQAEVSIKEGGAWEDSKYVGGTFTNVEAVTPPPQYTDHSEYIRYEGPGIESDKVGYRFYLDWRNGFDVFGKTTSDMVLQDVGLDGYASYHEPAPWGLDILKVGDAVGIGGYGFWNGEKIIRVSETANRATRIIENGALTSTLEISYDDWNSGSLTTDLRAMLTMKAGSHLVHTRLETSSDLGNIAIGIPKHADADLLHGELEISGHAWTYVATWGPQALAEGNLGLVLLFRKSARDKQTEDEHNIVSVMKLGDGRLEYYFGAVWSQGADRISTREAFVDWLEQQAEKLTMPLRARIRTAATEAHTGGPMDSATALEWSVRLAESAIERVGPSLEHGRFDSVLHRSARWSYTTGLLVQALDDLSAATGDPKFATWGKATLDSYVTDDGRILTYDPLLYNIDHVNPGKMLLRYLERTGDDKYQKAADAIRAQLTDHPRTSEGAFWHKKRYPWQLWLDGVYMGMPFLAHYGLIQNDMHAIEEAVGEAIIADARLRDAETGLYYHAWDEKAEQVWADPDTGLSNFFWSRGMGWYAAALVDLLDFVPEDRTDLREPLIEIIGRFADTILLQRVDGVWYQVTDMPQATGNYPEASGSSMFVYMLAKAVNKGYLDAGYQDDVAASFTRLVEEFANVHTSGLVSLKNVCRVAGLGFGRDGSYRYYMSEPIVSNDPKGVGPFIMAGIEVSKMLGN